MVANGAGCGHLDGHSDGAGAVQWRGVCAVVLDELWAAITTLAAPKVLIVVRQQRSRCGDWQQHTAFEHRRDLESRLVLTLR